MVSKQMINRAMEEKPFTFIMNGGEKLDLYTKSQIKTIIDKIIYLYDLEKVEKNML